MNSLIIAAVFIIWLILGYKVYGRFIERKVIQADKSRITPAEEVNDGTRVTFYQESANRLHFFTLVGDQWMIEGYFLRWSTALRWLGAEAYYRITRFSGRYEQAEDRIMSIYQMHPEEKIWGFLLRNAEKIPGVDTAYGIGAFQYPSPDTFYVFINDTGFILRKR